LNQAKLANENCYSQISADSMRVLRFYTFKQSVTHKHSVQTRSYKMAGDTQRELVEAAAWNTCSSECIHISIPK